MICSNLLDFIVSLLIKMTLASSGFVLGIFTILMKGAAGTHASLNMKRIGGDGRLIWDLHGDLTYDRMKRFKIHVVHPDPYRGYMSRPVHADVIISQGHWLPHYSTLIAVHQLGRTHVPLSFAIACSLERRVSGVRLADEADVLSFCNQAHARCSISFGWNRIPFSMQPTHEVHAGDAFTIQAGLDEAGAVGTHCADRSTAASASADHHTHANDVDYDMVDDGPPDAEEPHSCEASHSDSSLHSNDLSLLVYRLHAPEAHGFTQGRGYTAILNAAIRACRIPRSLVRCQHALHVNPTGILPEHEEAVLLQTIDDIAPGSDEKLVLVDIEIHLHPLRDGLVVPADSRKVMKVNPHLHPRTTPFAQWPSRLLSVGT